VKALLGVLLVLVAIATACLLAEVGAFGGAWVLHHRGLYDDEIRWLEAFQPFMPWERGVARLMSRRVHDRVERALYADRIDRAVVLFRDARTKLRGWGLPMDQELLALGVETYRRAADRMVKHGRFSEAADWDDSLFVLAIRAQAPHQRYMALAGFMEGLDLRVRDGKPCAALARIQWAKRGLGGIVPGMQRSVEEDLSMQCAQQRARARR
jgi:hypothetical protein